MTRPRHKLYYEVDTEDSVHFCSTLKMAQRKYHNIPFVRYKTLIRHFSRRDEKKVIVSEYVDPSPTFAVGEIVAVCYDGKWSRAVEGKVIEAANDHIIVEFKPWANEECGFVQMIVSDDISEGRPCYGGWLSGQAELGIMRMLGTHGDWYSVWKAKELIDEKYSLQAYDRQSNTSRSAGTCRQLVSIIGELQND